MDKTCTSEARLADIARTLPDCQLETSGAVRTLSTSSMRTVAGAS